MKYYTGRWNYEYYRKRGRAIINWKLRLQNKTTLVAIIGTVLLLLQQLGLKLPDNSSDIINTVVTLLVLLGVVTDPTTSGISDSTKAMSYAKPKEDK